MNNFYKNLELNNTEFAIALEDYEYGNNVKCNIPSLMPFLSNKEIIEERRRVSPSNIKNKKLELLGIGKYTSCNYIELYIPKSISEGNTKGKKGDKFIITFIAGDINKCNVIGRYK